MGSIDDLDFTGIEEILEDPKMIEKEEQADIMENIHDYYELAREESDLAKKKDLLDWAYEEKERYEWELGVQY